ncbi:hypothetical protein AYI68_g912 [Smittium mucronatum]|uniref:Uncharacterized protein n=1 Tax=Smittium mucronatum TaxID=133383 RepID=A0A1R0H6W4_9FUNG|nr:hypothetical protein AYI68_g912 [Smittium mucronatum]
MCSFPTPTKSHHPGIKKLFFDYPDSRFETGGYKKPSSNRGYKKRWHNKNLQHYNRPQANQTCSLAYNTRQDAPIETKHSKYNSSTHGFPFGQLGRDIKHQ